MFDNYISPSVPAQCPQCRLSTDPRQPFCERCKFDLRYGSTKNNKKGRCIYCDEPGKLSDEHIFPKWLQEQFPKRHSMTVHTLTRPEQNESPVDAKMQERIAVRKADPYDIQVRNVCEGCNNGWMSELQNLTKPLIEEIATGHLRDLSDEERTIVARWAAMTSISLQSHGRILSATSEQRNALMNEQMPCGWRVSRGLLPDSDLAGHSLNRPIRSPMQLEQGRYLPGNMSVIVIERAIFQTFSTWADQLLPFAIDFSGFVEQTIDMQPIWPLGVQWDNVSGLALTAEHLEVIPGFLNESGSSGD